MYEWKLDLIKNDMAVKEVNAEKLKALQLTMEKMDKAYGKGAVMKLGDAPVEKVEVIPSGSITLDLALGINGYPKGRVVEIYGPESSGKTTLAIHAIAEVQKQGGIAAFIDAEHAFDPTYAQKLGVDIKEAGDTVEIWKKI
jgi:recombination protein RecA